MAALASRLGRSVRGHGLHEVKTARVDAPPEDVVVLATGRIACAFAHSVDVADSPQAINEAEHWKRSGEAVGVVLGYLAARA